MQEVRQREAAPRRASAAALSGPSSTAQAIHSLPLVMSDPRGWRGLSVCLWQADVEEAALPAIPELMMVLHTGGPVEYCRSGDGTAARSLPGQLSVFAPGVEWSFRSGGTLSGISIHFSLQRFEHLRESGDAPSLDGLATRIGFTDPLLSGGAQSLLREARHPTEKGSLYVDTLGDALGLHVLRVAKRIDEARADEGILSSKQVSTAREILEGSIASGISLEDLASAIGVSRHRLRRGFLQATGMPPHRYLTDLRIERAKTLLLHGDETLADVALACGFSSQAHFCERFRTWTGTSPGRYRSNR